MKRYKVLYYKRYLKDLEKIPKYFQEEIRISIMELEKDPRPSGCKKLKGNSGLYRIRSGKYRIVYSINDDVLTILIIEIGHRKDVYECL